MAFFFCLVSLMVILLKNTRVLDYLLKNGEVVIFRKHKKDTKEDWVVKGAPLQKVARVEVELIDVVYPDTMRKALQRFLAESSFFSVREWLKQIIIDNKGLPLKGYLYRVRLIK